MPIKQLNLQCAVCDTVMPHNQPAPNHVLHAILSLFVLGLWIPIWILVTIGSGNEAAACVKCGNRRKPNGPATNASAPVAHTVPERDMSTRGKVILFGAIAVLLVLGILFGSYFERL